MSLLGFDTTGSATINGLTEINANNVFSDVLYYDAGTTPVNVKTAIDGITVDVTALEADVLTLQGEMNTAQSEINTLQSEMNTAQSDINTLQSEMNNAQSDINTLQSEMNTAQADIIALGVTVGVTAVTVAALVVSQAAQDVTIAAHTGQITVLQGEMNDVEADVAALEVKTTDQSWGSLTGTSFSTKVNVGGGSGVVLNTSAASEFNSGLKSSSVEPLAVGSALAIGATQTSGTLNIGTLSTRSGDINIGTGASAKATVIGSSASTNTVNGTTTIAGTANINTTSLSNTNIGNGAAGGNFTVNAAANSITGTTNTLTSTGETEINCVALDINASGALTIDPLTFTMNATELIGTAMTWQSNTTGQDLVLTNPTAGSFSVSAGNTQNLYFTTTGGGDFAIQSSGDTTTSSVLQTTIAATTTMDLIAGSTLTIDSVTNRTTATTNIALQIAGNSKIDIVDATVTINPTTTIINQINGADKLTITSTNVTINPLTTIINQINGTAKLTITSTTTTHDNNSTFNGNVLIQQTTYPPTSTSALGYTNSATTFTDPMTTAFISRSNFSLPSKGVWLIVCGYEWGTNAANTVETKRITLSTTSGGTTPAAYGLQYNEQINDAAGAAGTRQFGTIMGVVSSTAALTIYVNANSSVASGANTELRTNVSWTRIG